MTRVKQTANSTDPEWVYQHKMAAVTYARWRGMADKADGEERMRWVDKELQAIYDKEYLG